MKIVVINNCTNGLNNCSPNATCTYTGPGAFSCGCNPGFSGSGTSCAGISPPPPFFFSFSFFFFLFLFSSSSCIIFYFYFYFYFYFLFFFIFFISQPSTIARWETAIVPLETPLSAPTLVQGRTPAPATLGIPGVAKLVPVSIVLSFSFG